MRAAGPASPPLPSAFTGAWWWLPYHLLSRCVSVKPPSPLRSKDGPAHRSGQWQPRLDPLTTLNTPLTVPLSFRGQAPQEHTSSGGLVHRRFIKGILQEKHDLATKQQSLIPALFKGQLFQLCILVTHTHTHTHKLMKYECEKNMLPREH